MESATNRLSNPTLEGTPAPSSMPQPHLKFTNDSKISSKTSAERADGLAQAEQDIFVAEDPKSNFS